MTKYDVNVHVSGAHGSGHTGLIVGSIEADTAASAREQTVQALADKGMRADQVSVFEHVGR